MMQISEFDHSLKAYNAIAQIMNAVWHEGTISVDDLRWGDEERPSHLIHHRFMAEVNEQIVGFGSFSHNEKFYHPQRFWLQLDVLPECYNEPPLPAYKDCPTQAQVRSSVSRS